MNVFSRRNVNEVRKYKGGRANCQARAGKFFYPLGGGTVVGFFRLGSVPGLCRGEPPGRNPSLSKISKRPVGVSSRRRRRQFALSSEVIAAQRSRMASRLFWHGCIILAHGFDLCRIDGVHVFHPLAQVGSFFGTHLFDAFQGLTDFREFCLIHGKEVLEQATLCAVRRLLPFSRMVAGASSTGSTGCAMD